MRAFGEQRFELDKFNVGNEKLRDEIIRLNNMFAYLWGTLDIVSGKIVLVSVFGIIFAVKGT